MNRSRRCVPIVATSMTKTLTEEANTLKSRVGVLFVLSAVHLANATPRRLEMNGV